MNDVDYQLITHRSCTRFILSSVRFLYRMAPIIWANF